MPRFNLTGRPGDPLDWRQRAWLIQYPPAEARIKQHGAREYRRPGERVEHLRNSSSGIPIWTTPWRDRGRQHAEG